MASDRCGAGRNWRGDFSSGHFCGPCEGSGRLAASGRTGASEVNSKFGGGARSLPSARRGRFGHSGMQRVWIVCSPGGGANVGVVVGAIAWAAGFLQAGSSQRVHQAPHRRFAWQTSGHRRLGGNGRRLVQLLAPFGVSLRATDYYPVRKPPEVFELWGAERLQELASVSDILILSLPLNTHTRNLISEDVLRAMPRGGYLINVARGQVVDEQALVGVLQDGHLVGAGLDVTYVEPLPVESPLWDMSNVIITPHVGAQAASRVDDSTRLAVKNLSRFFRGEQLWNIVDKKLGFPHPDVMAVNQ
ncbi:MAG: NAD(P)-dependent oxidoreductase [Pirellulaceae bacterium]